MPRKAEGLTAAKVKTLTKCRTGGGQQRGAVAIGIAPVLHDYDKGGLLVPFLMPIATAGDMPRAPGEY